MSCCIGWEGETLTRIAKVLHGDEEHHRLYHDRLILPGATDLHVHFRDPGQTHKETFGTGSAGAACGGVTTVVDMPNTTPPTNTLARYSAKLERAADRAHVDFGLWAMGQPGTLGTRNWRMFEAVVTGWKVYPYGLTARDFTATVARLLKASSRVVMVHAEHPDRLGGGERVRRLEQHTTFRAGAEAGALRLLAPYDDPRLHLAHLSSTEAVTLISRAPVEQDEGDEDGNGGSGGGKGSGNVGENRESRTAKKSAEGRPSSRSGQSSQSSQTSRDHGRGWRASCEVTPHHLLLATKMEGLGLYGKVDPPLQRRSDNAALWQALNSGLIDIVASDHAPHTPDEKESDDPPSGMPGVETMVPLMLQAIRERRCNLDRAVEALCGAPARRLGLAQIKGSLTKGFHADIMVVNMKEPVKIRADDLHSRCGWTPYEGWLGCFPERVWSRGTLVSQDREVVKRPGHGKFINRFWNNGQEREPDGVGISH